MGYIYYQTRQKYLVNTGFSNGFSTELAPAKPVLEAVQMSFTGGLHFDQNGDVYREVIEDEPQYVGYPSPEIEAAWDSLLKGLYVNLVGNESSTLRDKTWHDQYGKYEIWLDVMHTLHCVNQVRKAIDHEYYGADMSSEVYRMHNDHCLGYLCQSVQCHSDLTPISFNWSDNVGRVIADWRETHTCRNFSAVKEWADKRFRR